ETKLLLAADDNVLPPRQRLAARIPRLAANDHRVTDGKRAKMSQVLRQAPRQAITGADDAVACDCGNQRYAASASGRAWLCAVGWCIVHSWFAGCGALTRHPTRL